MDFYEYQRPVGKIFDTPNLRNDFISVFDTKTKKEMVQFGLAYGKHILEITGLTPTSEIEHTFVAMQRWLDGKVNYHEARNIAFRELYTKAREENDIVKEKFYKTFAQIACIPHVKFHGLWATDFAVTLINVMHPNNIDEVAKERKFQIQLLNKIVENIAK
ncbi:MAG: hypothetical protein LBG88_00195 [Christensenellaceae bacterium]|jgi:hypothetical protein|nr:hypothetical protein [Christensenellaceae bacterium]